MDPLGTQLFVLGRKVVQVICTDFTYKILVFVDNERLLSLSVGAVSL